MPRKTNFEVNGHTYYRVTATVGHDADGKPIRKQFIGSGQRDAEAKRDEYLASIGKGLSVNFDKAVFGVAFEAWFENVLRPAISLSTYGRYEIEYRMRIKAGDLAGMKLADIRAVNVQTYYNNMLKTSSANTVRAVHKLLVNFFSYCVKADLLAKNPMPAVELPKADKSTITNKAISDADIDMLLQAARNNIDNFVFVFAVFTGLREGEILALAHSDIDSENNIIRVNKSVKYMTISGEYSAVLSDAKTPSSVRHVPILDEIQALLKAHIKNEKEKHLQLGIPFDGSTILFSSTTGTYRDGRNVRKSLIRLCKRIGVEKTTFHSLRHTFCTILAKHGVPLKTASELMGHSNIAITAAIYTHVDMNEKRKAIQTLSAYFNKS